MRYRPILVLAALVLFSGAAGPVTCSQQLADDEAALLRFATKVRAGVAMAAQDIQSGIDLICANRATISRGADNIRDIIRAGGAGPKTSANLAALDNSLATLNNVCNGSPGVGSPVTLASLFRQGYAAYLAAKASANAATVSAANGT